VPVTGGAPTVITASNKGADQNPVYSPDGRFIAYASQARAGFEADRWRLFLYDRAARTAREVAPGTANAESYFFAAGQSRPLCRNRRSRARQALPLPSRERRRDRRPHGRDHRQQ
jgi:hypothetical protein